MMNGIQFQSVQTPNALSSELRSVIRDNVLQFYVQGNGMDTQEEGITALYERLSQEDKLDGESNSIANQKMSLAMTIVSSRFGPTETIPRPMPVTSAMRVRYFLAFSGRSSYLRTLVISHFQPGNVS